MKSIFRTLKYKNFRLFFPGLMVAQIGIWTQNVAISWLVYDITNSAFVMGSIMFLSALPLFFITPFAGVIIDKFDKQKLLMIIQNLFALQAFIMSVMVLTNHYPIWSIAVLGVFLNIIAAIDSPLRQSMFVLLVDDKKDLSNAIALNATCFNAARLLGPAIAGIVISTIGAGYCFLINFLCFIPINILVKCMKINEIKDDKIKNETVIDGLKEGINYVFKTPKIGILMMYIALFSFLGMTYPMLMPIYTADVMHKNADTLGFLMSVAGVGAIGVSLFLAAKSSVKGLKFFLNTSVFLFGAGFIILGYTSILSIAMFAMLLVGIGTIGTLTSINTLIQTVVEDDIRGRVMSLHSICYLGTVSVSNFFAGSFTHAVGISKALTVLGVILCIISIYFFLRLRKYSYTFSSR